MPVIYFTRKKVKFTLIFDCQNAFECLKNVLINALILKILDPNLFFEVLIDASIEEFYIFLLHKGSLVAYEFKKFNDV